MKKFLLITLLALCGYSLAAANVIYVDCDSPYDPGSGTLDNPFRQIQPALDAAVNGDTVEIAAGIYSGLDNYNLDPKGKSITIKNADPDNPEIVANTIIDPNQAGRGFYIHSGEDANCNISGLTIRNAYTGGKGAGLFCYNSSPSITNCTFINNSSGTHGGAIFSQLSNISISKCVISDNSAVLDGGGWECWSGTPNISNCIIKNNKALYGNGGGIDCFTYGNASVTNCTLVKNFSDSGGGIFCLGSEITLKNTILWSNDANNGPQIGLKDYEGKIGNLLISYCDVQNGQTNILDPCQGIDWGMGNIDTDPCFVLFDPNGDPNLWDFHLKSKDGHWNPVNAEWVNDANSSLAINAGDPNFDWSLESWPNGKRINIGAFGGTNQASKSGNIADLNTDTIVNFLDLAEFGNVWGINETTIEDLDNNGTVDIGDIEILAANWLRGNQL